MYLDQLNQNDQDIYAGEKFVVLESLVTVSDCNVSDTACTEHSRECRHGKDRDDRYGESSDQGR